ncbi:MAG TPA: hypothetical protein ENN69_08750 [Spirochaetia bacterium]|nr:hypothetical protein [Spirochaetia bacterium]
MNIDTITLDKIKRLGIQALVRELGPAGMIRFIQQYETGEGDYSQERHNKQEKADVRELAAKIRNKRKK